MDGVGVMITLTLTAYSGATKKIDFLTESEIKQFISALPNKLDKEITMKVECDLLGISGHLRGLN